LTPAHGIGDPAERIVGRVACMMLGEVAALAGAVLAF
jgi:hypothetical protein